MNLRKLAALCLSLLLALSAAACGGTAPTPTPTVPPTPTDAPTPTEIPFDLTPESKKITVWIMDSKPDNVIVQSFLQAYPDYEVDFSVSSTNPFGNPDKTLDLPRLAAAIASGTQPDLFLGYMTTTQAYYTDMFAPLDIYLENDPDYSYEQCDDFTFSGCTFGDSVYFLPYALATRILVWNKELFDQAGLDPETPPKTWSELEEFSKKLCTYHPSGKPKTIGMTPGHINGFLLAAGYPDITNRAGTTLDFNNDNVRSLMEWVRAIPEPFGGMKVLPQEISFLKGTAGMSTFSADGIVLLPVWTNFRFGLAPLPLPDGKTEYRTPFTVDNLLGIPKKAKNPKGGWLFGKFMMTEAKYDDAMNWYQMKPENCVLTYITHKPTRERLYEYFADILTEDSWNLVNERDRIMQLPFVSASSLAVQAEFDKYLQPELEKMLRKEINPQDFLINAQAYGESLLEEFIERKAAEGWTFGEDGSATPPGA